MKVDAFDKVISQFERADFNVIRPGGHQGDLLIYLGLEKFLKRKGLKYRVYWYQEKISPLIIFARKKLSKATKLFDLILKERSDYALTKLQQLLDKYYLARWMMNFPDGSLILIEGGGNVNDLWPHGIRLLKILLRDNPNSTIIVAPQSYYFRTTNFPSIFRNFQGRVYLFSREKYSYVLLKKMNLPENVEVLLSQDTVFYLSREDFPQGSEKYNLLCLRKDKESIINEHLRKKIREVLYTKLDQVLESDVPVEAKNFQEFISIIGNSRSVFTDRLHVAALAAIMGKRVFLFPNIYWKNKGVYEYSLTKFDNVTFVENPRDLKTLSKLLSKD